MKSVLIIISFVLLGSLSFAHEGEKHMMKAPEMPKDFDKVKALVGEWEATSKEGDKEEKSNISFELTAGGTIIMERLFTKSPHEMVSMYHAQGKKMAMTHYCMLGNQPEMTLQKADDKTMHFEMAS